MDVKKSIFPMVVLVVTITLASFYAFNFYKKGNLDRLDEQIIGSWTCKYNRGFNSGMAKIQYDFYNTGGYNLLFSLTVINKNDNKSYSFKEKGLFSIKNNLLTTTSQGCNFTANGSGESDPNYQNFLSSCKANEKAIYTVLSINNSNLSMTEDHRSKYTCKKQL